jgi:hypothetical protein
MNQLRKVFWLNCLSATFGLLLFAQKPVEMATTQTRPPVATPVVATTENLRYSINWPSGLSLGEVSFTQNSPEGPAEPLRLSFFADAGIPGFRLEESASATTSTDFCSGRLVRETTRGSRTGSETTSFDQKTKVATRRGKQGGKTETTFSDCGRDALSFLYFVRRELKAGRIAPSQKVFFGSTYDVSLRFAATERIKFGDSLVEADKLVAAIRGPRADLSLELYFRRDDARTPLLAKLPLDLGVFTVELLP